MVPVACGQRETAAWVEPGSEAVSVHDRKVPAILSGVPSVAFHRSGPGDIMGFVWLRYENKTLICPTTQPYVVTE